MSQGETEMSHYILQFFKYDHLPDHLQEVSKRFCELAVQVEKDLGPSIEKEVSLRRLLEAKDCAVRAGLIDHNNQEHEELMLKLGQAMFPHLHRDEIETSPDHHTA